MVGRENKYWPWGTLSGHVGAPLGLRRRRRRVVRVFVGFDRYDKENLTVQHESKHTHTHTHTHTQMWTQIENVLGSFSYFAVRVVFRVAFQPKTALKKHTSSHSGVPVWLQVPTRRVSASCVRLEQRKVEKGRGGTSGDCGGKSLTVFGLLWSSSSACKAFRCVLGYRRCSL